MKYPAHSLILLFYSIALNYLISIISLFVNPFKKHFIEANVVMQRVRLIGY